MYNGGPVNPADTHTYTLHTNTHNTLISFYPGQFIYELISEII